MPDFHISQMVLAAKRDNFEHNKRSPRTLCGSSLKFLFRSHASAPDWRRPGHSRIGRRAWNISELLCNLFWCQCQLKWTKWKNLHSTLQEKPIFNILNSRLVKCWIENRKTKSTIWVCIKRMNWSLIDQQSINNHGITLQDRQSTIQNRWSWIHNLSLGPRGFYDHGSTIYDHGSTIYDHGSTIYNHGSTIFDHRSTIYDHGSTIYDHVSTIHHYVQTHNPRSTISCHFSFNSKLSLNQSDIRLKITKNDTHSNT